MRVTPNIVSNALGLILLAGGMGTTTYAADPNCLNPTLNAAGEGRRAYLRLNCYSCHGMHGTGGMGPNIVGEGDGVNEVVPNGSGEGMPAFKNNLCANDLTYLSAYLKTLGTRSEQTFTHWWEAVPSR